MRIPCQRLGRAFLIAVSLLLLPSGYESTSKPRRPAAGIGNVRTLQADYARWKTDYVRNGGDGMLVLALGYSKGLSAGFTTARGMLSLDLMDGSVVVEVSGLADGQAFDLWLVENRPGPGRSVKPEPGDAAVRVGSLRRDGSVARLAARLGRELLAGFKLDLAVVARAGEGPGDAGVLFGSPSLFQRLYHSARHARAREGNLFAAAFRALIPGPAHADETTGPTDLASLVDRGEFIFFNETFEGNGRTCGTCHPANNNLTLDPAFIATLPPDDPLFVAEFQPALAENFENPVLMRRFGLILENVDGFGDLQNKFVMRGVPHTLALSTSRTPAFFDGTAVSVRERTGWGGDGAPGTGTLREFAMGAVRQHFTKTLNRIEGADFRLPTNDELDALEAFQLSLGRSEDLNLSTMVFKGERAALGKQLFLGQGKCFNCHADAGANVKFGPIVANANFNTGVEDAPNPAAATGEPLPRDGGFGTTPNGDGKGGFGNGTFNTPPLVEAADTPPFFHNNAVDTLEEAVAFYNSDAFNSSPGAQRVGRITLTDDEVAAIAGFLRVINALENIRSSIELYERAEAASDPLVAERLLRLSGAEIGDAIRVLRDARLHPAAVRHLEAARGLLRAAIANPRMRERLSDRAIAQQKRARAELIAD